MNSHFNDKDLANVDVEEQNDVLNQLTPEELEQLKNEDDPADSYLPPSELCREQTKKKPTGKQNRDHLIKFLEEQGRNEKDWNSKPFFKEIDLKTDPNDCVDGVFSDVLETNRVTKSVDSIRIETARDITKNENYEKIKEAEKWMNERYPQEANTLLFTAGLINNNGTLKVEDEDLDKLDKSLIGRNRNKRGKPFDDYFQQAVAEKGTVEPQINKDGQIEIDESQYSYHHIIPNNELVGLLKSTKDMPKEERKIVLQDFLNKDHIKKVIIENDLINKTGPKNRDGHFGKLIHAAVSNNPHNLVYGPGCKSGGKPHRGRDSGREIDRELLEQQTKDYKDSVEKYESNKSLSTFSDLPPTKPVNFKKYTGTPKVKGKLVNKYYADNGSN